MSPRLNQVMTVTEAAFEASSLAAQDASDASPRLRWRQWRSSEVERQVAADVLTGVPLKSLPTDAAATLADRTVIVVGLGAVGGVSFEQLARLGVGTLIGIDLDTYEQASVLTQPSLWEHAGLPKAVVQGARAHAVNPAVHIRAAVGRAQDVPRPMWRMADAILAAPDNLETMVWLGGIARGLGKRLVQASVEGHTWTSTVRAYDLAEVEAPCPACGLSQAGWRSMRHRQGCDPATARWNGGEPTRTVPAVCGHAATLAVAEVIKGLLPGVGQPLSGGEYAHCLLTHRGFLTRFERDPRCRLPHRRWDVRELPANLAGATLSGLAAQMGKTDYQPLLQVRGETPWISFALCGICGGQQQVRRFARLGDPVGTCDCQGRVDAGPLGARSIIPAADLRACWDQPLCDLGLDPCGGVALSLEDDWTWFLPNISWNESPAAAGG